MDAAQGPPECRCGLPMLRLPGDCWACAECDQGKAKDRNLAAPWFVAWQERRQSTGEG